MERLDALVRLDEDRLVDVAQYDLGAVFDKEDSVHIPKIRQFAIQEERVWEECSGSRSL